MKAKHYFKHFHCFHVPWIVNNEVWISVDISSFRVFLMFVIFRFFFHLSDRLSCAVNAVVSHFIIRTWSAFFFSWPTPGRTSPHPLLQFSSPYQTLLSDPKKCYVRHNPNLMNLEGKLQYYQETSLSCKRVRERKKEKTWQKDMVRSSGVPKFLSGTRS